MAVPSSVLLPRVLQASYALTLELSEEERNFDDKIDILETNGLQQVGAATFVGCGPRGAGKKGLHSLARSLACRRCAAGNGCCSPPHMLALGLSATLLCSCTTRPTLPAVTPSHPIPSHLQSTEFVLRADAAPDAGLLPLLRLLNLSGALLHVLCAEASLMSAPLST